MNLDEDEILWKHIEILYEADCKHPPNMRYCPKLSANHVTLTNSSKMRVFLAAQVMF